MEHGPRVPERQIGTPAPTARPIIRAAEYVRMSTEHQKYSTENQSEAIRAYNVWNRASFKLKRKHVINSPEMWVRSNGAFDAVIDRQLFDGAQAIIAERSYRMPDEAMLGALGSLLKKRGHLSGILIDEANDLPSSSAYRTRFGSLLRAYMLIGYVPFMFERSVDPSDIEISDETFIITKETALAYREAQAKPAGTDLPITVGDHPSGTPGFSEPGSSAVLPFEPPTKTKPAVSGLRSLRWTGEVPSQKWMNFYSRVLSKFATGSGLRVTVNVEIAPEGGVSEQKVEETRSALRELGLNDMLDKDV